MANNETSPAHHSVPPPAPPPVPTDSPVAWVDDHIDYLYRFAMHRVADSTVAEELVQDTFLSALQARETFQGRSTLRTWLTSILRHKIADHFRARPPIVSDDVQQLDAWCEDRFGRHGKWKKARGAWSSFPDDAPEREELVMQLGECLRRLPASVAEMFVLYEQREVAATRLAEAIGVTPGTLWVRLYRARLALRECLHEKWWADR